MNYFYLNSNKTSYTWNEISLYGGLFIEIDGYSFPDSGWDDIISSVLDMWIDNVQSLIQSNFNITKDFYFMDGPYYFKVSNAGEEIANITLYRSKNAINSNPYKVSFYNLISEICKITSSILQDKKYRGIKNINEMRIKYTQLRKAVRTKGYKI